MTTEIKGLLKSVDLKNRLRKQIVSKMNPGDILLPETQLARKYKLGRITVRKAIAELVEEGLLYRIQGRGTFVAERKINKTVKKNIIGLFMPARGHLYGEMASSIIHQLQLVGILPLIVDTNPPAVGTNDSKRGKQIQNVLDVGVSSILVDGQGCFPVNVLTEQLGHFRNVIFFNNYEFQNTFPEAGYVLSDTVRGGYLGIRHLLELGHQKIIVLTHKPSIEYPNSNTKMFESGCRKACVESGINFKDCLTTVYIDKPYTSQLLEKTLTGPECATAVFAFGDNRAKTVYDMAAKLNLKIPDDLAVVGYYNTPWCEIYDVPLTSISIREDEIARLACQKIIEPDSRKEKFFVEPQLIIRKSSEA